MKQFSFTLFICFLSTFSFCKDIASFKLTVTDRFDKKGIQHVKVELYSTGKKSRLLTTLYSNDSGVVQFDSLANGNYYYVISCDEYIGERGMMSIDKGWSFETTKELDLTDERKVEILKPYLLTKEDAKNLEKIVHKSCKDSLENNTTILTRGFTEFNKKLKELIVYPQDALEMGIEGRINVTFIVNETGEITKVGAVMMGDPSLTLEALFTVLLIDRFEPAICNGENVQSFYTVPITFSLN